MPLLLEMSPDARVGGMKPRHRVFPFRARQDESGDGPTRIGGFASVAGNINSYGEVMVPGCWVETLADKSDLKPLVMGYQHREAIGRWTEYSDTRDGLDLEGPISGTSLGRDAAILVRDGVLTGLSVGFWPVVYQFADPGERCTFDTPHGQISYQFDEWVVYIVKADLLEASLVIAPADDDARAEVRSALAQASKALPVLARGDDASWEDAAYSMALLMGGRGAAAFADLPDLEHRALFQRVAQAYEEHGKTPPEYTRHPTYADVEFRNDEREVFHDRYLRKTIDALNAGLSGVTGPLSAGTREAAQDAANALTRALDARAEGDQQQLAAIADELRSMTRSLKGEQSNA